MRGKARRMEPASPWGSGLTLEGARLVSVAGGSLPAPDALVPPLPVLAPLQ